jgi:hypothetical protein
VALLLVVQGLASLHIVIVPHRRCAEHGELVEGALPVGAGGAERAGAARSHASAPDGQAPATHGDHDEHCLLCSLRAPSPDATPTDLVARPELAPTRAPQGTERPKTSIPLFALAPKSSPPAGSSKAV